MPIRLFPDSPGSSELPKAAGLRSQGSVLAATNQRGLGWPCWPSTTASTTAKYKDALPTPYQDVL